MELLIRKPGKRELKQCRHPAEETDLTFAIAISVVAIAGIAACDLFLTSGFLGGGLFVLSVARYFREIFRSNRKSSSVKVSERNFPDLHFISFETREAFGMQAEPELYVVADTRVALWSARWPGKTEITISSGLVEAMNLEKNRLQASWIAARNFGRLWSWSQRSKALRIFVRIILFFVPLRTFVFPYLRSLEYTGDQLGLLITANLDETADVFHKLLAGAGLSQQVSFTGLIQQGEELKGDWAARLSSSFSSEPSLISRYLNLLAFTNWRFPSMFEDFTSHFRAVSQEDLSGVLPRDWKDKEKFTE